MNDAYFLPIPGFKVAMPYARHFVVSNQTKNHQAVLSSINRGLAKLQSDGSIERILIRNGLLQPSTKDWVVVSE